MTEFTAPPFHDSDEVGARTIYPHVVAKTEVGDRGCAFVTASTNNNDTTVQIYAYWYIPEDGSKPYLVIEVDDEPVDSGDVHLVIRRNDGLIYEGTNAE